MFLYFSFKLNYNKYLLNFRFKNNLNCNINIYKLFNSHL